MVLRGVLEDLLDGTCAPRSEDDAVGGDGHEPILPDAIGEELRDMRRKWIRRLVAVEPGRDAEARRAGFRVGVFGADTKSLAQKVAIFV